MPLESKNEMTNDSKYFEDYYGSDKVPQEKIKQAIKDLSEAFSRLNANRKFKELYGSIKINDFLPLMIKESHLDNSQVSRTGAKGYFQLKQDASKDAQKELKKLGINKSYNPKDSVNNCILGIIYFLHNNEQVEDSLKGLKYGNEFDLMAYNGGVGRIKSIIVSYKKENPKIGNTLNWNEFVKWLVGKLENNINYENNFSGEYNIFYRNWFKKDWSNDNSTITFGNGIKTKKSKIYEMVNYVEKIKGIKNTNQGKKSVETPKQQDYIKKAEQQKVVSKTTSQVQRLGVIINYTKNKDEFHGDGLIDSSFYQTKKLLGINSKYRQIQAIKGDGVISLLKKAGIEPTKENKKLFYDINELDDKDSWFDEDGLIVGAYYLLPNVEIKIDTSPVPSKKVAPKEIQKGEKPDFYAWLDGIEVKSHELKGKLFILDPGHGGGDPGAIPLVKDKDGEVIPYKNSDIKEGKVVENGKGDGRLHVIEAKVTMDTCYRLAKLIKEHGGDVKITHFFQRGIDDGIQTTSSNGDAPGLLDEIQNFDTWGDGSGDKFDNLSVLGLKRRVKVREIFKKKNSEENTYFISIHADRLGDRIDTIGLNILHAKSHTAQSKFAKELAEAIGIVRNMETTYGSRQKPIYVLNPKVGATEQNVLIELGNMNNENTAYVLRNGEKRQEYAEGIFKGLLKVSTEKK